MWRRAGHGGQAMAAPLLLVAVLLAGWAATPCNAQGPYAAPGSNSILFLNSTLNVRHAHLRRDACAYAMTFPAAVKHRELQIPDTCVNMHAFLNAQVITCVRCNAVGRNHIDAYAEKSAGVPVGVGPEQQLHIKSALMTGGLQQP